MQKINCHEGICEEDSILKRTTTARDREDVYGQIEQDLLEEQI